MGSLSIVDPYDRELFECLGILDTLGNALRPHDVPKLMNGLDCRVAEKLQ